MTQIDWESVKPDREDLLYPWRELSQADDYMLSEHEMIESVLDLGANAGYFMLAVLERFPKCYIVGYEASSVNHKFAVENLVKCGFDQSQAHVIHSAVWSHSDGVLIENESGGCCHVLGRVGVAPTEPRVPSETLVSSVTLDQIVDRDYDLLKLDVEGAEFPILEAASTKTLAKFGWIVMELHDWFGDKRRENLVKKIEETHTLTTEVPIGSGIMKAVRHD